MRTGITVLILLGHAFWVRTVEKAREVAQPSAPQIMSPTQAYQAARRVSPDLDSLDRAPSDGRSRSLVLVIAFNADSSVLRHLARAQTGSEGNGIGAFRALGSAFPEIGVSKYRAAATAIVRKASDPRGELAVVYGILWPPRPK